MNNEHAVAEVPEVGGEWVIRIVHPQTIAHTSETHLYPSFTVAEKAAEGVGKRLCSLGVEEFTIHIINQTTGVPDRTLTRRVEKKLVYEAD